MAENKKRGFLSKLGFKSKADKLAEEAAARAEKQKLIDEQMAARMAAINAAALKAAREQDEKAKQLSAEEEAAQLAEEQRLAEIQAARDVARAKQLAEEQARKAELEAARQKAEAEAEAEAKRLAEDRAAREAEAKIAAEKAAAERAAEEARLKTEAEAAQAKAASDAEAAQLKAKAEAEAKARAEAEAARLAEEARLKAEAEARAEEETRQAEAARQAALEKAEADRLKAEAVEAERRARIAEERAARELKEREILEAKRAEEAAKAPPAPEPEPLQSGNFFDRITGGLRKSTNRMSQSVSAAFTKRQLDDAALEELEDILVASDLGLPTAMKVTDRLREDKFDKQVSDLDIKIALAETISDILTPLERPLVLGLNKPQVLLFVGVNGSGKTTTLGKIAKRFTDDGKKVLIAAGDTFRAAAVEQLTVWGERAGAPVMSAGTGADASGLVWDAMERAKTEDYDILMIDTAGRLQNRTELMDELEKIIRVIRKQDPSAPHHSILVLDATVGQNALTQTEAFHKTADVTGLIMTKLDGTAKGGVLVALSDKFNLPIHYIGIGERIEDLESFSAPVFSAAISGVADAMTEG